MHQIILITKSIQDHRGEPQPLKLLTTDVCQEFGFCSDRTCLGSAWLLCHEQQCPSGEIWSEPCPCCQTDRQTDREGSSLCRTARRKCLSPLPIPSWSTAHCREQESSPSKAHLSEMPTQKHGANLQHETPAETFCKD